MKLNKLCLGKQIHILFNKITNIGDKVKMWGWNVKCIMYTAKVEYNSVKQKGEE